MNIQTAGSFLSIGALVTMVAGGTCGFAPHARFSEKLSSLIRAITPLKGPKGQAWASHVGGHRRQSIGIVCGAVAFSGARAPLSAGLFASSPKKAHRE